LLPLVITIPDLKPIKCHCQWQRIMPLFRLATGQHDRYSPASNHKRCDNYGEDHALTSTAGLCQIHLRDQTSIVEKYPITTRQMFGIKKNFSSTITMFAYPQRLMSTVLVRIQARIVPGIPRHTLASLGGESL
jgi:hypothetical protein